MWSAPLPASALSSTPCVAGVPVQRRRRCCALQVGNLTADVSALSAPLAQLQDMYGNASALSTDLTAVGGFLDAIPGPAAFAADLANFTTGGWPWWAEHRGLGWQLETALTPHAQPATLVPKSPPHMKPLAPSALLDQPPCPTPPGGLGFRA